MKPEQMPSNNNQDNLSKKALELEKMNRMTENATGMEMKETMILKMDKLNEVLVGLERQSGLSPKEIMENYEELSNRIVNEEINSLIQKLDPEMQEGILADITKNNFESFIKAMKSFFPQNLAYATGLVLLTTIANGAVAGGRTVEVRFNGDMVYKQREVNEYSPLDNPLVKSLSPEDQKRVMEIFSERKKQHDKLLRKKKGNILLSKDIDYNDSEYYNEEPIEFKINDRIVEKMEKRGLLSKNIISITTKIYSSEEIQKIFGYDVAHAVTQLPKIINGKEVPSDLLKEVVEEFGISGD